MAATVWAWMAMPCAHCAASSWAMPVAPSTAALYCRARCRATRRLQGTPQARSQARATSLSGATLLLELAWSAGVLPRWADSMSLLGPAEACRALRSSGRGLPWVCLATWM